MRSRKVRLEDAYLNGQVGFKDYLEGKTGKNTSEDFYKTMLTSYDEIAYDGLPADEISFYIAGFFDDYGKEVKRREEAGEEALRLEEETWIQKIMKKNQVDDIADLGASMVNYMFEEIRTIYREPDDILNFLNTRLEKQSSYVSKRYSELYDKNWVKIEAKQRRESRR